MSNFLEVRWRGWAELRMRLRLLRVRGRRVAKRRAAVRCGATRAFGRMSNPDLALVSDRR